jgi:hypothetical protein
MFERFSDQARRVLVLAQEESRLLNHAVIGTEHLLLGLLHEHDGIAARALTQLGLSLEAVRLEVADAVQLAATGPSGSPPFTPRAKKVLELALREALQLGHSYIGTEHILLGLVREGEGVGAQVLAGLVGDVSLVRQEVIEILSAHESDGLMGPRTNPFSPERSDPTVRVISCSFCGRGSPESGQLISGVDAFICEHCIHDWSVRLGHERSPVATSSGFPGHHEVVAGPPPEHADAAASDIRVAYAGSGTESEDGSSVPTVQGGEALGSVLTAAKEQNRGIAPQGASVVTSVDRIVFTDPDHAAVWFSIAVDGAAVLSRRRGDAVIDNGIWKVARSTFCELMALAGVQCPPLAG